MLDVKILPILEDNYTYILQSSGVTSIIDPGESDSVINYLEEHSLTPSYIFNTHHHWDHVNGNKKIKEKYGLQIIGSEKDKNRIPNIDKSLGEGETFQFGKETIEIIETPGHTSGHICFYFTQSKILFSGDTLFSLGCGKLFEGTAQELYRSYNKIKALPDDTLIYCGHEYTLENGRFCLNIEPKNEALLKRMEEVKTLRSQDKPTIPTTLKLEKDTNVFLRASNTDELHKLRTLKDNF